MRAGVMSPGWFGVADETRDVSHEPASSEIRAVRSIREWNPESFAREQIRRLIGQVFRGSSQHRRQIVFSAVEPETDISSICIRIGVALATDTRSDVAMLGKLSNTTGEAESYQAGADCSPARRTPIRHTATQLGRNLWLLPVLEETKNKSSTSLQAYLEEIRNEFEYSILQGPCAGQSNEATAMAQFADGIVLVVSAQHTRRATARKVKQALEEAHARLLGAVLCDREFPIPEGIYRRL